MSRADHRFARSRLERFIDDELAAADVDRVAFHLGDCPGCSERVRFFLRVRAALQGPLDAELT